MVEWVNSWLFAGDKTIIAFKRFIETPNEINFSKTAQFMRVELGNKKSKLPLSIFTIKPFLER